MLSVPKEMVPKQRGCGRRAFRVRWGGTGGRISNTWRYGDGSIYELEDQGSATAKYFEYNGEGARRKDGLNYGFERVDLG